MIDRSRITGLVLAGGRGVRMGSLDKGLAQWHGRPLVAHAIDRLDSQVGRIVVSANRHRATYERFGHRVVGDRIEGYAGPLAGLHAALEECATEYLVVVPCDAPLFPADLVARLGSGFDGDVDATLARTPVREHPVFCMVRRTTLAALVAHLEAGHRSVAGWLGCLRLRAVSFDDEDAFRNLNTPEELRAAQS